MRGGGSYYNRMHLLDLGPRHRVKTETDSSRGTHIQFDKIETDSSLETHTQFDKTETDSSRGTHTQFDKQTAARTRTRV